METKFISQIPAKISPDSIVLLPKSYNKTLFEEAENNFLVKKLEKENLLVLKNIDSVKIAIKTLVKEDDINNNLEKVRGLGAEAFELIQKEGLENVSIIDTQTASEIVLAFLEGFFLANYTFQKYKSTPKPIVLKSVEVYSTSISEKDLKELENISKAVHIARDLVNEPLISLTAEDLAEKAKILGKEKGFFVEVFDKKKIEALKMGGILAINAGSLNPPTFTVMEYKSKDAKNGQPLILVGKGVVYDTGGLSLKPTPNSMDYMKCDMAGAAAVISTIVALADNQVPVHVIGLIPATENRLDGNAITPGDVITMHNGKTVEIMNTDAEGRIILADALSYASRYNPGLVIDIATLTGSAVMAIGNKGIVYMGTAEKKIKEVLSEISLKVHERLVEFPLWEEFGKYLDSDIADIKNIGGSDSGAIVGGKFLEQFISYPWLHMDIAAMAFNHAKESYRGKGGTGVGVRLLYEFIKKYYQ